MAWSINRDNEITLTRGDTFRALVEIIVDGENYTPTAEDSVRFALKHREMKEERKGYREFDDAQPLIVKQIPSDTMILELEPNDTKELGFGKYKYDIEITFEDGTVDTFIADTVFEITPEVH